MSDLNVSQRRIAETLDGMVVVDAGPGTGKTNTIVARYLNLISRPDVKPSDVLMLTFTNNAATEMEGRIKKEMAKIEMAKDAKLVQAMTFDAFCLSIVMDSPEDVGSMFDIDERLTRGATISTNETLNRKHFSMFLDRFLNDRGDNYGDWAAVASQDPVGLIGLINRLMSRGIYPLKCGWFGIDVERQIRGNVETILKRMKDLNVSGSRGGKSKMADALSRIDANDSCGLPELVGNTVPIEALESAASDPSREGLFKLVHDVYRDYVRTCISEDHLTFGINAMLAFALLYSDQKVRERNSRRYLMIDEFQDTNANQLMVALMVLSEPNLCVVGDWKQGIYGFRFVSTDNITNFEARATEFRKFLNVDTMRVRCQIPEVTQLTLDVNYRSSAEIVEKAFECMDLPGSSKDESLRYEDKDKVHPISTGRSNIPEDGTEIRYVICDSPDDEAEEVAKCIRDYIGSGRYRVYSDDNSRPLRFGDVAILCRKTKQCRVLLRHLQDVKIPAYMEEDMDIMSTREGKLALAWLRYVNNERDPWGYVPIMADLNYSLAECMHVRKDYSTIPEVLKKQREDLYVRKRRVTEMLTRLYAFYGLDNDVTQAIINTLSAAHRGSLLTISDLIHIIEDGIGEQIVYPVENSGYSDAVRIMTMHKAKGLEFPAVIIPYMDEGSMPAQENRLKDRFLFDERIGIRASKEVGRFGDYAKVCTSWRTRLARKCIPTDYNEERRLMFVAMSRAGQYETLICGPKPSLFMTKLSRESYTRILDCELPAAGHESSEIERPDISGYPVRRRKLGVHSIMRFLTEKGETVEGDEIPGNGVEYGDEVHKAAQALCEGWPVQHEYPELDRICDILERANAVGEPHAEVDCALPVRECGAVLDGKIDLLVECDNVIEIHDYKTDVSDRFEPEYRLQLSVYAHAASGHYGKPARCFIEYVSMGRTVEFEPLGMEVVTNRVIETLQQEKEAVRKISGTP